MASLNSVAFDGLGPPSLSTKNSSSSVCPGDPLLCGGGGGADRKFTATSEARILGARTWETPNPYQELLQSVTVFHFPNPFEIFTFLFFLILLLCPHSAAFLVVRSMKFSYRNVK